MCVPQSVDTKDPIVYTVGCSCNSNSELEA